MKCGYNSCRLCGRFADDCEIIKEHKDLQKRLDTLQGFLDRDVEYDELKNRIEEFEKMKDRIRILEAKLVLAKGLIAEVCKPLPSYLIERMNAFLKEDI